MKKVGGFDYDGRYNKLYYKTTSKENGEFEKDYKFKKTLKYLKKSDLLCEFGCGDASKLILYKKYVKELWGFDISRKAIEKAKKKYPNIKLYTSGSGKIFKDNKFDVTISLYTLEHVENPEQFIQEMIRVTKKGGYVINICPNFGSPLFPSPPILLDKNFFQRIFIVLKRVLKYRKIYKKHLYHSVRPVLNREWKPDYDTISELSLEKILAKYKNSIVYTNSFWSIKPYFYFPIFLFSSLRPIKYWGANCFFVIKKQ